MQAKLSQQKAEEKQGWNGMAQYHRKIKNPSVNSEPQQSTKKKH